MQELFPPVQMYILLTIVATWCTIIAANIREADAGQLTGLNLLLLVLIGVETVSAGQIVVALAGVLIGKTIRGDLWQVVIHIPCNHDVVLTVDYLVR